MKSILVSLVFTGQIFCLYREDGAFLVSGYRPEIEMYFKTRRKLGTKFCFRESNIKTFPWLKQFSK